MCKKKDDTSKLELARGHIYTRLHLYLLHLGKKLFSSKLPCIVFTVRTSLHVLTNSNPTQPSHRITTPPSHTCMPASHQASSFACSNNTCLLSFFSVPALSVFLLLSFLAFFSYLLCGVWCASFYLHYIIYTYKNIYGVTTDDNDHNGDDDN